MMRTFILYAMVLLPHSVFASEPQQKIDSMVIKIASWTAVTDIRIECTNFETSIDYMVCVEQDSCTISKIINELHRLEKSSNGNEDVRCKILFYSSDKVCGSCCIGKRITKIETEYYYTSSSLITVIDSVLNKSKTKLRKEIIEKWDYNPSLREISRYIASQSERFYDNSIIKEDLEFTAFCNVGEEGKTLKVQFTKNRYGKDKDIPIHVTSVLKEILYDEIKWDVPPKFFAQWVPINIYIKKNASDAEQEASEQD